MKGSLVLVDTCVFISHFRTNSVPVFKELLLNDQILLSRFVRLELLQGIKQSELIKLNFVLSGLHQAPIPDGKVFLEAEKILRFVKSKGFTLGIIDVLLAAEANTLKCPLFSVDKIFEKLAKMRLVAVL